MTAEARQPARDRWLLAVRTVVLVWGFELVIARVTAGQVALHDLVRSTAGWLIFAAAACVVLRDIVRGVRPANGLHGVLTFGPVAAVSAGILVPVAAQHGAAATAAATLAVLVILGTGLHRARSQRLVPSPAGVVTTLLAATAATWAIEIDPLPSLSIATATAVLWLGSALLSARPRWLAAAAVLALGVARLPNEPPRAHWTNTGPQPAAPDIILLSVDTLRADVAAGMRSYQRLAQHGITFLNVQTAAPWTLPSMATAFTGRRVPEHGAMHIAGPVEYSAIDTSVPTLAERLSAYGYDTAAVLGGNLFVGRRFGFARGFDLFDHAFERSTHALPRGLAYTTIARPIMARAVGVLGSKLGIPGLKSARSTRDAEAIVDRAKQIVADQRDRPLFLWLHFMDCHLPYEHNKKLSSSFQAAFRAARRRKRVAPFAPYWYTPEARQSLWDAYNKEVGHIDRAIEQFLESVMAPGHDRGRVIVLVSDHGEEFLEHGSFEHGHSLYQEVVGIPLIISDTRQATRYGTVVRDVVGLIDLAPTLLAAAGIADPLLPGHDLFRETGPTPRVTENLLYSPVPDDRFARRDGHWKAIVWRGGRTELYDLAADPNETHDLAGSSPAVVERMAAPLEVVASRQPRPVALSDAEREQLRALGYLGND